MKVQNPIGKFLAVSVVMVGALLILLYYYGAAGGRLPTAEDRYEVSAVVDEPQQLLKHADVRAAGITVGEVDKIEGKGARARVTLALEKDIAPVYADAKVLVRQKTLVGENYIELDRGTPKAGTLPSGSELPRSANREAVPIDRVLNSLDKETRTQISGSLRALGRGFDQRGKDLNELLSSLRPVVTDGQEVTDVLADQREQVAEVLAQGERVFAAIGDRRQDLVTLVRAAKTTAQAVSARDEQLKDMVDELPGTLTQARSTVQRVSGFSGRATPVVKDLRVALNDLKPVVADLEPTAEATDRLLGELPAFTKQVDPLLDELKAFSKVAQPALPALDAMLRQVNPALKYLVPYHKDLAYFTQVFGSNVFYDRWGAIGRCSCPVGDRSFAGWTPAMKQAADVLLEQGLIAKIQKTNNNHFAKPGSAEQAWANNPKPDYPRIEAGE